MGLCLSWRRFEGAGLGSRQVVGFGTSPSQALGTKEDRADVAAFREEVMCQAEPAYGNGQRRQAPPHSAGPWMQNLSHLNCLPYPNLPLALGGASGGPSPPPPTLLGPQVCPGPPVSLGRSGQQPTLVDPDLPPGSATSAKMASPAWPGSFLLEALPSPVSGLIKELCGLFMYGPSLIGVFVFSHYSQLDRAV